MQQPFQVLIKIIQKVGPKGKYFIYQHLFLSLIVCLLDFVLYNVIANINDNLIINLFGFSPIFLVIFIIIFTSLSRIILLYSTVITTALIANKLHTNLIYSFLKRPYLNFKKRETQVISEGNSLKSSFSYQC